MKTLEERLEKYEYMFRKYELPNNTEFILHFTDGKNIPYCGFCSKFGDDIENDFPELWLQKPKMHYYEYHKGFWWNPHFQAQRAIALENAIKLCEEKLK